MSNGVFGTGWDLDGDADEFRFVLFGVPHVLKKEGQYLICLQGLPPGRRKMHLAILSSVKDDQTTENVVVWVQRSGLLGLMSEMDKQLFTKKLKEWWTQKESGVIENQGNQRKDLLKNNE